MDEVLEDVLSAMDHENGNEMPDAVVDNAARGKKKPFMLVSALRVSEGKGG